MPVNLTEMQIDPGAQEYQRLLANLQGNILISHGRNHAVHLCVRFTATPEAIATWMLDFTMQYVTSARQQLEEIAEYRRSKKKIRGRLFGNLYLTAAGYERLLGWTEADLARHFLESQGARVTFRAGMEAASRALRDPAPSTWDVGYQGRRIHAMILLADNDPQRLQNAQMDVLRSLTGIAHVLAEEHGTVLRNAAGQPIEHFGYVDGRSQPLFFKPDVDKEASEAGITHWDPSAPLGLVLVPDPNVSEEDCFGSYLVFRKLEQNVKGFRTAEQALAKELALPKGDEELAGAMVIGRFRDGTPIALSRIKDRGLSSANDFTYADDAQGLRCPFHAHIRKVNPRGDTVRLQHVLPEDEREHRIVRRGITYGKRSPDLRDAPEYGVGLLFMCFQSDIAKQFAHQQETWANNPCSPKPGTGRDPLIGQRGPAETASEHQWPVEWGQSGTKPFNFGNYVTLKGGEFFFAPSLPFLKTCGDYLLPQQESTQARRRSFSV